MADHSFLLYAAVYLLAAVVFVPAAARLGLGSVIGYLFAGCVVGPFGIGFVSDVHAIFSFADALLLRPLPVARPGEVLTVGSTSSVDFFGSPLVSSYRDFVDVENRAASFEGLAAFSNVTVGFAADANARFEARGKVDELRCGARVKSKLVHDGHRARCHEIFSPRNRSEATQIALRPWSRISRAAASRSECADRLASLISIGRLTPVMTSTLP